MFFFLKSPAEPATGSRANNTFDLGRRTCTAFAIKCAASNEKKLSCKAVGTKEFYFSGAVTAAEIEQGGTKVSRWRHKLSTSVDYRFLTMVLLT